MRIRLLIAVLAVSRVTVAAQEHEHASAPGEKLGTVHFATSCSKAAQPQFDRAVALLHSFEFSQAIQAFGKTLEADQTCAIADWGIALSRWSNPFAVGIKPPAALQRGREAVEHARTIGAKTARERAYVDAVACLFNDFETTGQGARVLAYANAMRQLAAEYRDDPEASIFFALALAGAADPADKSYAKQLEAGAILETLFARQPDHPGLAHYIIHSYDVPPLAPRAIDAARRYAKIAPSAPHALHMPSHTFTRLGLWQDSVETNIASAAAARRDGATAEELHTMDYRTYAYLQMAQDGAARKLLEGLPDVTARFDPDAIGSAAPGVAGVFALAAIPARYALERGAWAEASRLEVHPSRFAYADALTWFARGLGAARSGQQPDARAAVESLKQLHDRLVEAREIYWAEQVEIQRRSVSAWLALAAGNETEALAAMRATADLEDGTEKSAITPGPLAPAREQLGEMLLQLDQPAAALEQFEATLKKEPNRFRAVAGAMRAAGRAGKRADARRYAAQLLKTCDHADKPERQDLVVARRL